MLILEIPGNPRLSDHFHVPAVADDVGSDDVLDLLAFQLQGYANGGQAFAIGIVPAALSQGRLAAHAKQRIGKLLGNEGGTVEHKILSIAFLGNGVDFPEGLVVVAAAKPRAQHQDARDSINTCLRKIYGLTAGAAQKQPDGGFLFRSYIGIQDERFKGL